MEPRGIVGRARRDGPDRRGHDRRRTLGAGSRETIGGPLRDLADDKLAAKSAEVGEEDWKTVERLVLIRTIDSLWVEHLTELDDMRRGIGLRGYAQQDPLNEFKREAFALYDELRDLIRMASPPRSSGSHHSPTRTRRRRRPCGAAPLARGAASLSTGNEAGTGNGNGRAIGTAGVTAAAGAAGGVSAGCKVPAAAAVGGSAIPARRSAHLPPRPAPMRASLGDQTHHQRGWRPGCRSRRPEAAASPRAVSGSAATIRAGAVPAARYSKCHGR